MCAGVVLMALVLLPAMSASAAGAEELPCQVVPDKPEVGFDLRFHGVYHVIVPLRTLAGAGGGMNVTMAVTPEMHSEKTAHLTRWFAAPDVPPATRGDAQLVDAVELGAGRFHVDWTMRDSGGRVCSARWEWEAKLGRKQRDFPLTLEPDTVAEQTGEEVGAANPRRVKVLLNLSPVKPWHSILEPHDSAVLFSILRGLADEPGVTYSGLLAFNLREQRIVYSVENNESIDLASLRKALHGPGAGTVSYSLLRKRSSETDFVTGLLAKELGAGADAPDAIVIIGSKVTLDMKVPLETLRRSGMARCPIFYLNYNPNPIDDPFRDTIGSALKAYKSATAYNIVFPHDLGAAVRDMLFRIGAGPR
jgi:hypothetical protein